MAYLERRCPAGPPCQQWHDPATFIIIIVVISILLVIFTHIFIIVIYIAGPIKQTVIVATIFQPNQS